jgi:ABC-type nickel/cobalt efflux system permease component RcnA
MSQIVGIIFLLLGLLSLIYNQRSAREYAETWGRRLKHGYAVGRLISIVGGILLLLVGLAMLVR